MHKVSQHPFCALMLVTKNDHAASYQTAVCSCIWFIEWRKLLKKKKQTLL